MKKLDYRLGLLIGFLIPALLLGYFVKDLFVPQDINLYDLELVDFDNNPINSDDLKGKNVLINFWATWCGPCIKEMPTLEKINKKLNKENWVLLMVNDENNRRQQSFFKKSKYDLDYVKLNSKFADLGILSIPRTYIWDKKGRLVYKEIGKIEGSVERKLMDKIESLN